MGLKQLALGILDKAFDDICPVYENEPHHLRDERVQKRAKKFEDNEREFDKDWDELVKYTEERYEKINSRRDEVLSRIRESDNSEEIDAKIEKVSDEYKIKRSDSKEERETKNRIKRQKTDELEGQRNSEQVNKRLRMSSKTWQGHLDELDRTTQWREDNYHLRRMEGDQIRMTLEWFINDRETVEETCQIAEISPLDCYKTVRDRLAKLGRTSEEIEEIIEDYNIRSNARRTGVSPVSHSSESDRRH